MLLRLIAILMSSAFVHRLLCDLTKSNNETSRTFFTLKDLTRYCMNGATENVLGFFFF